MSVADHVLDVELGDRAPHSFIKEWLGDLAPHDHRFI